LPSLGHLRAEGMEPLWSPVVATSGKSHPYASAEMRLTKPERLPSVATDCRERCMVSRRVADRCRRLRKTLWGAKNRVPPANPHFSERAPNFDTPHGSSSGTPSGSGVASGPDESGPRVLTPSVVITPLTVLFSTSVGHDSSLGESSRYRLSLRALRRVTRKRRRGSGPCSNCSSSSSACPSVTCSTV
jgi:hypothetical protein